MAATARPAAALLAALLLSTPAPSRAAAKRHGLPGRIVLDGQPTEVRWTDGDSFKIDSGPLKGFGTRLSGYNTLEAFGPVHRIAGMGPGPLAQVAAGSAALLAAGTWDCRTEGKRDGYGRALVACPDAAATLVRAGHAMVYAVEARPDPALLAVQREAQSAGRGMWAAGVPPEIITSLHSAGERDLQGKAPYDRLCDTRTGLTRIRQHRSTYRTCQEVCVGEGPLRSCMVYVPFERRYNNRPDCIAPNRSR